MFFFGQDRVFVTYCTHKETILFLNQNGKLIELCAKILIIYAVAEAAPLKNNLYTLFAPYFRIYNTFIQELDIENTKQVGYS